MQDAVVAVTCGIWLDFKNNTSDEKNDPVQTPISLDKGLYKHVHLFCLTFSANVGHYMALIEAYRGLDRVNLFK